VERTVIRRDVPVTVRYVREGDRMLVNRVIVHRTVAPAATVTTVAPAPAVTTATETTTTTSTTVTGHDAKEIEKRREKIAKLERELSEHPDRDHVRGDLAEEKAKLERLERDVQERK
jgi:predicted phage tail protein